MNAGFARPYKTPPNVGELLMTTLQRREKARLRSERWRRAHGIGPRKPAQRPWLALGISRSTYYRRRAQQLVLAKARQDVAMVVSLSAKQLVLRATYLADRLAADLMRCVLANAAMARELGNSLGTNGHFKA
jgi:hypothetical protein